MKGARPFVVMLLMLALAVGGWLLIDRIWRASKLQDCVMSGRGNCDPLDVPGR